MAGRPAGRPECPTPYEGADMTERLRPRDLALLATESPSTPMHNATVEIFEPGESGFDYSRLVELISDRIALNPLVGSNIFQYPVAALARNASPMFPTRRISGICCRDTKSRKRFPLV